MKSSVCIETAFIRFKKESSYLIINVKRSMKTIILVFFIFKRTGLFTISRRDNSN